MRKQLRRLNKSRAHNRTRRARRALQRAFWDRKTYIAVGDIGAHSGHIAVMCAEDIWSSDNPYGWTYQEMTGSHGTVLGEFATLEESQDCLNAFLKCDAAERGVYCYSHNPSAR